MYNQILYFIVALLLITIQQPGNDPFLAPWQALLGGLVLSSAHTTLCYIACHRLRRRIKLGRSRTELALQYHRLLFQLSVWTLAVLAVYIYGLNIKFYLHRLPGFEAYGTLDGLAGLSLYVLHLSVVWLFAYPVYRHLFQSNMTRIAFLRGHLAFNVALLIPWFLISLLSDLVQVVQVLSFLNSDVGQLVSLGVTVTAFLLFAPWLVVRLWGCEPLPPGRIRSELEDFCARERFRVEDFLLWPLFGGEMLTAGIMGILPGWRYILITQGLLRALNLEELKAVMAHEMGHVRRYHLLFYLVFFLCYSALIYVFHDLIILLLLQHETLMRWMLTPDALHLTLFSLAYSVPLLVLLVVYFRFIFGFFLRNSERQADLYSMQIVGHPFTLVSSFEKIAFYSGNTEDLPSWHHYSIRERIEFLLNAHRDRSLITRHHRKLYGSAGLFLCVAAGLIAAGLNLDRLNMVQRWQTSVQMTILEQELPRSPKPELYASYGGLLFEAGRLNEAEALLRKALEMAPEDASILNNLAWLYATSPEPYFNPEEALNLALQAAELKPEPHILDTLAEAYYVNQRYAEAIETIERALQQESGKRDYLLRQKEKFKSRLRDSKTQG